MYLNAIEIQKLSCNILTKVINTCNAFSLWLFELYRQILVCSMKLNDQVEPLPNIDGQQIQRSSLSLISRFNRLIKRISSGVST